MSVLFRSAPGVSCFLATPGEPMQVGRRPERSPRSVRVKDGLISRNHFAVSVTPAGTFVEDTGSTSGTYMNDQQIRRVRVSLGDRIKINSDLVYTVATPDETLGALIQRGPIDFVRALRIVRQLVWHLTVMLYERQEHHGALDPSQILVSRTGAVTLLDHGWNAVADNGFTVEARYLAHETRYERETYPSSDMFALGWMLVEMITGKPATGEWPSLPESWPSPFSHLVRGLVEPSHWDRLGHDKALYRIDAVIADLTGAFYRDPTIWLCRHPEKAGLLVGWRGGPELVVRVAQNTPVSGGFARMLRERFAAWVGTWPRPIPHGTNQSPTTDEVEQFLRDELTAQVPGFSVSRTSLTA